MRVVAVSALVCRSEAVVGYPLVPIQTSTLDTNTKSDEPTQEIGGAAKKCKVATILYPMKGE